MSDAMSKAELKRISELSDEELFEQFGDALEARAVACLNEALLKYGGKKIEIDGEAHNMSYYIDPTTLRDVLVDARKLAEERNLVLPQTVDIELVTTDNEAIGFIQGIYEPL